jgi:choline dehydrogenase-like flavoprotein
LPDGEFLPAWGLNCVENYFSDFVRKNYSGRHVIYGRCAHITEPQQIHIEQGRGKCVARNLCQRGCPFGGYYNSNSTTIPWAGKTGNMTLKPYSVVDSIMYDKDKGKATGVRVIDSNTKEASEYFAPVIFVNAGTLNTNLLLLNSTSDRFPQGIGNDNGLMG